MPEKRAERPDDADRLNDEVQRILFDPAFERAPTQCRLLVYLAEQTIANPGGLSQFSIAVDGLGRPDDYDLTSDSYPRVQMSRLRRNLLSYYSRNPPREAGCVYIRRGEYRLRLGPPDQAYPELFKHNYTPISPKDGNDRTRDIVSLQNPQPPMKFMSWRMMAVITAILASTIIIALAISEFRSTPLAKPMVGLDVTVSDGFVEKTGWKGFSPDIQREAENYVSKSFVSSYSKSGANEPKPDYVISLNFGLNPMDQPDLKLVMRNTEGRIIYSNTLQAEPKEKELFIDTMNSNLSYLLAPNGTLAHEQIRGRSSIPDSPYSCFLLVEINRSEGKDILDQVNSCLNRFKDNEYRPYWYARKAVAQYLIGIGKDLPITTNGEAWNSLQEAFRLDRYNAFANRTAAKVESARGNCQSADSYTERTLERGPSYPALISATLVEAVVCGGQITARKDWIEQIRTLARTNPDPDPLLKLYLMLGTLAIGDSGACKRIANSLPIEIAKGDVGAANAVISRSLSEQGYFRQNRKHIDQLLEPFVWNQAGRQLILNALGSASAT
jgi:hypothetical protein